MLSMQEINTADNTTVTAVTKFSLNDYYFIIIVQQTIFCTINELSIGMYCRFVKGTAGLPEVNW